MKRGRKRRAKPRRCYAWSLSFSVAEPRRCYAWSLSFSVAEPRMRALPAEARQGLGFAQVLATNARERSREALRGLPPHPVSVEDVARDNWLSPIAVYSAIKQARIGLFGKD